MDFDTACQAARASPPVNDQDKLKLYALFKQAVSGDAPVSAPSWFSGPTAVAKWTAWNQVRGLNATDSKNRYITHVQKLNKRMTDRQ